MVSQELADRLVLLEVVWSPPEIMWWASLQAHPMERRTPVLLSRALPLPWARQHGSPCWRVRRGKYRGKL